MGFFFSVEQSIADEIRQDRPEELKNIIAKNNFEENKLITPEQRTLVQLCCYYGSPKTLEFLINLGYDINIPEKSNNNTPLFIACKFNYLELVILLLTNENQECKTLINNDEGINEFEVAFLRGNYNICYYLLYTYNTDKNNNIFIKNKKNNENDDINMNIEEEKNLLNTNPNIYLKFFNDPNFTLEKYMNIHETYDYPLFNITLFFASLKAKILPEKCPSFAAERKRTLELLNKVPDPNESWGHFVKRLLNFELYNPPMVDKHSITRSNSLYMRSQMNLISMEYGINMDYSDQRSFDNRYNDEESNFLSINKGANKNNPLEKTKVLEGEIINVKPKFNLEKSLMNKNKLTAKKRNVKLSSVLDKSDENKLIQSNVGIYRSAREAASEYTIQEDDEEVNKNSNMESGDSRTRTLNNNYVKRPGQF